VTLQRRTVLASVVALGVIVLMTIILLLQFSRTVAANASINDQLSPAADFSAALTLAQANASLALADATLLSRGESVQDYRTSVGQATTLLKQIDDAIVDDEASLSDLVVIARTTQTAWVDNVGTPIVTALDASRRTKAMKITGAKASQAAYSAMTSASRDLSHAINMRRDESVNSASGFATILGIILVLIGVIITAMVAFFVLGMQRWVLAPLMQIRHDLKRAAHEPDHRTLVRPVGPPELIAVAKDAEQLRRGLVKEIDEALAARQALMQDAPLAAAMRDELAAPAVPPIDGVAIAGATMASEGVIAGDWWEAVQRPDGSIALVIADVSGHDPVAGVIALRVRAIIRAALLTGETLSTAIEKAAVSMTHPGHFVTALIVEIAPRQQTLMWCNAGHLPAVLVREDGSAHQCEPTGPLVSSLGGYWSTRVMPFMDGDVVVGFTDGLVEIEVEQGDQWDESVLADFVAGLEPEVRHRPDEVIQQLLAHVRQRATSWNRDDVTVIAASRTS